MKRLLLSVIIALSCLSVSAQRDTIRIAAIGNSYTVDAVNNYLYEIFDAAGMEAVIGNLYIGGCTLERHWRTIADTTETTDHVYFKIVGGETVKNKHAQISDCLSDEPWDVIVFQQGSGYNGIYESHFPWMHYLMGYIESFLEPGSYRLGYQQSWAYHRSSTRDAFKLYDYDQDKMFSALLAVADRLREDGELDFIIPSFMAIQNGRYTHIGDNFHRDNTSHLEKSYGRYTVACTWFESISGIDVRSISYRPDTISDELARLCRECAHAAVANPYTITILEQ